MATEKVELGPEENAPNENWLDSSKFYAEQIRHLKSQLRLSKGNKLKEDTFANTSEYIPEETDYERKLKRYIEVESKSIKIATNANIAAKLTTAKANPEQKLAITIELASSGYTICALDSILSIAKDEALSEKQRINAFLIAIKSITTNTSLKQTIKQINHRELIYEIYFTEQIARILRKTFSPKDINLGNLVLEIQQLINLASKESSSKTHKEEWTNLLVEKERIERNQVLTRKNKKPIIRSLHHLACTGGTLFSKCIASMHNVALISETNPLNRFGARFEPTNPLLLLERGHRELSNEERIDIFKAQIDQAFSICQKDDVDLVLRDHSHTDFHFGSEASRVCPIRDSLVDYNLLSVVTVRHPLDSYLSLTTNGWEKQFYPNDLNEYCKRYLLFIEKYNDLKIFRYEDFCEDPCIVMKEICDVLELQYNKNFLEVFGEKNLSGDSGRKGLRTIEQRPRRPIPHEIQESIEDSDFYHDLVRQLGY